MNTKPNGEKEKQQPQPTLLTHSRLRELLASVAEGEVLDPLVETALLRMADEFAVEVCKAAVELAAHRKASVLAPKDVLFVLGQEYGIEISGCGGALGEGSEDRGEKETASGPRKKAARSSGSGDPPVAGSGDQHQQPLPASAGAQSVDAHAIRMAKLRQAPHSRN